MRYLATLWKELLVLFRDRAGIAILIIMPSALIFIMVIVQDVPFKDFQEHKIELVVYNGDQDTLGATILRGLRDNPVFEVFEYDHTKKISALKKEVQQGKYKVAIVVPEGTSIKLRNKIDIYISSALYGDESLIKNRVADSGAIQLYFDPVIKQSFKHTVINNLEKHLSRIELKIMFELFNASMKKLLPDMKKIELSQDPMLQLVEMSEDKQQDPGLANFNSVQHNVPAYTIFGMFFIVITLASNIIKERDDGSEMRLRLIPGTFWPSRLGRVSAYLIVTLIQAVLMLSIGLFIMPYLGYPKLIIGNDYPGLVVLLVAVGLAACGMGLLIGTAFKTHQQSAVFGAVSVVIMSALGGVWVPIFVMPDYIQEASSFIPVYWGLEACNDLFLRTSGISEIMPNVIRLVSFFVITMVISLLLERKNFELS